MMTAFASILIGLFGSSAHAVVDMRNANFADTWTDIVVAGSGYDLRVQRTYNSRSIFNGVFGFGWCSDFESQLIVSLDGTIRVRICGAGQDVIYKPKGFSQKSVNTSVARILEEVKKKNKTLSQDYLNSLAREMKRDNYLRDEFQRQLGLNTSADSDTTYVTQGRENENIIFNGKYYKRSLADGTSERYDLKGRLTHMHDKNGNYLEIAYEGDLMSAVVDNNGRKLSFSYHKNNKKVKIVKGPGDLAASYEYSGEDLVSVQNAWGNLFRYKVDELHNITEIRYPDGTKKQIFYKKDEDWVVRFIDRRDCEERYTYESDKKDPLNHYWSVVEKKCGGKVTNQSKYEFWHKMRADGVGRYLERTKSVVNGSVTESFYHPVFGKPTYIAKGLAKTEFEYFDNGMIKQKREAFKTTNFEYRNTCNKISRINTVFFQPNEPAGQRVAKKEPASVKRVVNRELKTAFDYNSKCNVSRAENSDGQKAEISYDSKGRIVKIVDQSKKSVLIEYDEKFGKPAIVKRPGLGEMKVQYTSSGQIKTVDSKDGAIVAVQVAAVFNNLLELISPATSDLEI